MKKVFEWLLQLFITLVITVTTYTIGYEKGKEYCKQHYMYGMGNKVFYTKAVHAAEFKISNRGSTCEIYAPNFIIDSSSRDTVFASKFILTTEITNTP